MTRNAGRLVLAVVAALGMPAAHADVVIGVAGPLTGELGLLGEGVRDGAGMAVADINDAGGIDGEPVVLQVIDDGCSPERALSAAEQFAVQKAALVVGHFCSGASIAASAVYDAARIVQISPASIAPSFTDQRPGPGIFRVSGRSDRQGQVAGAFLAARFGGRNIAIVNDGSGYGKDLADGTRRHLNAAGVKEVMNETYTAGEQTYDVLVSRLRAAGIDVLYLGGYHTEAGLIVRQMREQGMATRLVAGDALLTEEYWQITGQAGAGTLMTFSPDPAKDPANAGIVAKFEAAGIKPEGYVLYSYGAIQAWAQAVTAAGTTDFDQVVATLNTGTFNTVLGSLRFDATGDVTLPGYVFYEWQNGTYDYLN